MAANKAIGGDSRHAERRSGVQTGEGRMSGLATTVSDSVKSHAIVAIDPGQNGGIAYAGPNGCYAIKMPPTPGDVLEALRVCMAGADEVTVYLEKVGGFVRGDPDKPQGQPGSAMFSFGHGVGFIEGAVMAYRLPLHLVTPQAWIKFHGLGTRGKLTKQAWKNKLKAQAQRLYPQFGVTLCTADALLLLSYAREQEKEQV